MTYERLLEVFQTYVENDYQASCDSDYVNDALSEAGLTTTEMKELGFGWILDLCDEEEEDDE